MMYWITVKDFIKCARCLEFLYVTDKNNVYKHDILSYSLKLH